MFTGATTITPPFGGDSINRVIRALTSTFCLSSSSFLFRTTRGLNPTTFDQDSNVETSNPATFKTSFYINWGFKIPPFLSFLAQIAEVPRRTLKQAVIVSLLHHRDREKWRECF